MGSDVIIQAFTELASTYEETVDREVREFCGIGYREFIRQLASMVKIKDNSWLLDVASGTALSSLEIAACVGSNVKIVSLDITPAMQLLGKENIARAGRETQIRQICGSGMDIPCATHCFDAVICGLGTHHMQVPALLAQIHRVLKPKGQIVLADIGAPARWRTPWGKVIMRSIVLAVRTFRRSARWQAEADAFLSIHSASEWRELLARYGFLGAEVYETRGRKFWHPDLIIIRAQLESTG